MRLKKNDRVKVISGNHRGKEGKILKIFHDKEKIIVEGVNIIKRHTRPTQKNPQGGITQKEAPIHVSNVMLIDPKSNELTRIGMRIIEDESGKKKRMRYAVKSGEIIVS
ncbi:MAG: 50S ribosomal protein L24 [Ignavibacteria bacterium]